MATKLDSQTRNGILKFTKDGWSNSIIIKAFKIIKKNIFPIDYYLNFEKEWNFVGNQWHPGKNANERKYLL